MVIFIMYINWAHCFSSTINSNVKGAGHLTPEFFTNFSSSTPADAGIKGALVGSIWLILSIIPISIILE